MTVLLAWLGVLGGLVALANLIWRLAERKRPSIVECMEVATVPVFDVRQEVSRLKVTFNDEPVTDLSLSSWKIRNSGTADLTKPIHIHFRFPGGTVLSATTPMTVTPDERRGGVEMKMPFLNSYRKHKSIITVAFVVSGSIEDIEVSGSGPGWSVRMRRSDYRGRMSILFGGFLGQVLRAIVVGLMAAGVIYVGSLIEKALSTP